jgi:hypothetical protein
MKGYDLFQREIILKNLLLKNHWARKDETNVESSSGSVDSSLFKS